MKVFELHNQPVEADTYEASMALNQLLKIGKHAIKIHNMIDDAAEMEAWVAKKIDLAGDYVKKVHGYMQGEKAGLYDDGGLTEDAGEQALANDIGLFFVKKAKEMLQSMERPNKNDQEYEEYVDIAQAFKKGIQAGLDQVNMSDFEFSNNPFGDFGRGIDDGPDEELVKILAKHGYQPGPDGANDKATIVKQRDESVSEDAGEGHMSKSTLYHTAKYAIELMSMINKGDDLEGWVQSKLNKAADYLQGVHNYEEYQKLNPYREELDATILQKHAGIVQKNIDEILARETSLDDVDTKPGMMRILAKRVNEVEKEIAKEQRKQQVSERMPASIIKHKEKLAYMSDKELAQHFKDKDDETLKQMAWRHGYGKMSPHYVNRRNRGMNEGIMTESPRAVGRALANLKYAKAMAKDVMDDVDPALTKARAQAFLGSVDETIGLLDKMYNPVKEQTGKSINENSSEHREVKAILDKHGITKADDIEMNTPVYDELFSYYMDSGEMPYGVMKARDGMPDEWIWNRVQELGLVTELEEGLKDWAKNLAAAGVIVGAVAGLGSINNAIDNSVPAVKAMNTAYEMAVDQGHTELADQIKKDLSAVKVRLDSGRDLNYVKAMQDKYSKFMQTEGLTYESKLAVMLNQQLK